MPRHGRGLFRWLVMGVLLWTVVLGRVSHAQDEDQDETAKPRPVAVRIANRSLNLDRWFFSPYTTEDQFRANLDSILEERVRELHREYGLTQAQEKKLRLAARVEVGRLFAAVDEMRSRFDPVKGDPDKILSLILDMTPERDSLFADPFGERSFFEKVLARTLVGNQAAKYEKALQERALAPFLVWVDLLILNDDEGLGLRTDQRQRLAELLRDHADTARESDRPTYEELVVRVSRLPGKQLRPIFDETQWRRLQQHVNRVKAGAKQPPAR